MIHPTIYWLIFLLSFPVFYLHPCPAACVLPSFLLPLLLCHSTQAICLFYPLVTHTPTAYFPLPLVLSMNLPCVPCLSTLFTPVSVSSVCLFMFMYGGVCICVCVPVHMCVSKYACGGQKSASNVIPQDPFTFITKMTHFCVRMNTHLCVLSGGQRTTCRSLLSPYTMWTPGIKLTLFSLIAGILIHGAIFSDPHFVFWDKVSLWD